LLHHNGFLFWVVNWWWHVRCRAFYWWWAYNRWWTYNWWWADDWWWAYNWRWANNWWRAKNWWRDFALWWLIVAGSAIALAIILLVIA
jgi:hypothetical protein